MDRSLPMRGRKRPNSPHPAIIPESSRFGLVALAVTLLFLWTALTSQTILRLHHSNHTRLRSGGLKVQPWYDDQNKELANRQVIQEQAFGEALDPDRLERLGRYEVHLDRKFERVLAMLLRLKDLRKGTITG